MPLVLTLVAIGWVGYGAWLGLPGPQNQLMYAGILGIIAVATMVATLFGGVGSRRVLAVGLIGAMCAFVVSNLLGKSPLSFTPYHDWRYASFLSAALVLTAFGVFRYWFVARWLALALAVGGLVGTSLNFAAWAGRREPFTFAAALHIAGSLLLIANLFGRSVRERFERDSNPIWSSSDPLLRSIRFTVLTFFGMIPMLFVYAWMQPVVAATATSAIAIAVFLMLSITLVMAKKLVGALGLALGGLALFIHTIVTVSMAYDISPEIGRISLYYTVFWLPAALMAMLCGARLVGPTVRLLFRD